MMIENCGVAEHDADCFCDVIVTDPVQINYGLTEVWHADTITRTLDLGWPWTGATAAELGESLLYAYDLWRAERVKVDGTILKDRVVTLLRSGTSMIDVARLCSTDHDAVMRALTSDCEAACWAWDEVTWLDIEAFIYDSWSKLPRDAIAAGIEARTGMNAANRAVATLADWYGVEVNGEGRRSAAERSELMRHLLVTDHHPVDVVETMLAEGFEVSLDSVKSLRKRMARDGLVESAYPARFLPLAV